MLHDPCLIQALEVTAWIAVVGTGLLLLDVAGYAAYRLIRKLVKKDEDVRDKRHRRDVR